MSEAVKIAPSPIKPRDGKSARDAVLRAATRLMHVRGYQNTSLDDVLRESGVGKGNFYYHFRSKEDLGYAILDQLVASFLERTLEPCFSAADTPPLTQIRCFLDRVLEAQRQRKCVGGCAMGNLASELSDVHEGFRERLASVFTAWRERMTVALREAQERGEVVADCEPEAIGHFLVAGLEGAMLLSKVSKDIAVMEQCVIEMKRYLTLYEVRS
jgi:TetR/AcrR family transcriptional regulator, transcriptional repressor for nem operon